MKGSFLVTRPNHEQTTKYLFEWANSILEKTKEKNIFTIDLFGNDANKNKFTSSINKFKPAFIYLNGHGSQNTVTGFDNEPILKFADNEELTKDKIVYALSCQSAKRLGKSCISSGAKAYLGYDEDFVFVFDENSQNKPAEDKTAANFLQPSNDLVLAVLNNQTSGEAYQSSQKTFAKSIVQFSLSNATNEEKELLPYLLWDKEHQVCLGDEDVKCEFVIGKPKNIFQQIWERILKLLNI